MKIFKELAVLRYVPAVYEPQDKQNLEHGGHYIDKVNFYEFGGEHIHENVENDRARPYDEGACHGVR